jgi:hypothetical protein
LTVAVGDRGVDDVLELRDKRARTRQAIEQTRGYGDAAHE